jgi:hypothetical protein
MLLLEVVVSFLSLYDFYKVKSLQCSECIFMQSGGLFDISNVLLKLKCVVIHYIAVVEVKDLNMALVLTNQD